MLFTSLQLAFNEFDFAAPCNVVPTGYSPAYLTPTRFWIALSNHHSPSRKHNRVVLHEVGFNAGWGQEGRIRPAAILATTSWSGCD